MKKRAHLSGGFRAALIFVACCLLLVPGTVRASLRQPGMFNVFTIDCGTGLAVYIEIPSNIPGQRPLRIVYDTGKGGGKGLNNDLVAFLSSEEIGLKVADGDFEGDVIDYFIVSHPHEDHYNGAGPLFECFDVRNFIESKQSRSIKFLKRCQAPAIEEIYRAKAAGKDAHFYVVGLPYPNGFDKPRQGRPYDEYAVCEHNLPDILKGRIDPAAAKGKVAFPFGPDEVVQTVEVPVTFLMAGVEKAIDKYLSPELRDASLEIDVLPVGTHFAFGRYGGFTIVHGDTIAAFDAGNTTPDTYKEAWPYYRECDLNDASVAVQVHYKNAYVLIPGDCEGRHTKPTKMVSLLDVFGRPDERYTKEDVERYLRVNAPEDERIPLTEQARKYIIGSEDLQRIAYYAFVTFDQITPVPVATRIGDRVFKIEAKHFDSPEDIPLSVVQWDRRSAFQRSLLHEKWRERLFRLYLDLKVNSQKLNCLKTRFKGWTRGRKPRLVYDEELGVFKPDWKSKVWTIINLVQLTERIYYVDPGLANIMAGMIMSSDIFLDYMNPPDPTEKSLRGEKHMIDVAKVIEAESGQDVLHSDVLFFGHHGSFTSSSIGFIKAVDPNVGIISADDKSYSGSTLPDFSAMFWNLNTTHPNARAMLHSIFFHADVLARKRGEIDEEAYRLRYSQSATKVFKARGQWPIPLWRTDLNDDLVNKNTLLDNILIRTDGAEPVWAWSRHRPGGEEAQHPLVRQIRRDMAADPDKYSYWTTELISAHPSGTSLLRPYDPSGQIVMFDVNGRAQEAHSSDAFSFRNLHRQRSSLSHFDGFFGAGAGEDPDTIDEAEDWTLREGR